MARHSIEGNLGQHAHGGTRKAIGGPPNLGRETGAAGFCCVNAGAGAVKSAIISTGRSRAMKRDWNLIRKILLQVEEGESIGSWFDLSIEGYSEAALSEHVHLLADAGYVEAKYLTDMVTGGEWKPIRLTWSGQDFLEASRNDTIWKKAALKEKGLGLSLDLLKTALIEVAKQQLAGG
jgi:hypothetical protein